VTAPTDGDIERAARAALRGELIVLPTETVYGIGTRPDDPAATVRLFEAKRRPTDLELPVLAPSLDAAEQVGAFEAAARNLARRFWPGPLTIVVPRTGRSDGWALGGDPDTIGLRVPAHPMALALLTRTGPLAVTSANRSGEPTPGTWEEIREVFGTAVVEYLRGDGPLAGHPSTVVAVAGEEIRVLRPGSLAPSEIAAAAGGDATLHDGPNE
jgi:L-threonylcarbamoyladenylate synthase